MDYSTYIQEYLEQKYRSKLVKTKEEVIKLKKKSIFTQVYLKIVLKNILRSSKFFTLFTL